MSVLVVSRLAAQIAGHGAQQSGRKIADPGGGDALRPLGREDHADDHGDDNAQQDGQQAIRSQRHDVGGAAEVEQGDHGGGISGQGDPIGEVAALKITCRRT